MTDDELDAALLALPLPAPPAGLRERILAATVLREQPAFAPWEFGVLGALAACATLACLDPHALAFVSQRLLDPATLAWLAVGTSSAWWISNLTLMPSSSIAVTKR